MTICYPTDTDWSCAYTDEQLQAMRADTRLARLMERSEALAWYTLASITAWQIGVCPDVIRPCAASCFPLGTWLEAVVDTSSTAGLPVRTIGSSFTPHLTGGNWVNSCGCISGDCGCSRISEVILPGPVGSIESVKIDGVVQEASSYRVDNGNRLVSLDPDRPWPLCQDMSVDDDEVGSFVVTYYRGAAPNEITRLAAGVLAAEFYKACTKDSKCRIPVNATTVTRGGTTIEIEPDLRKALLRIPEVGAVASIFNPHGLASPPRVLAPGGRRPRRATWMVG